MGHSLTWESSGESESEEMVSRCTYCGKFCGKRAIHGRTGLCYPCRETLREEGNERALESDSDSESASSDNLAQEVKRPDKGEQYFLTTEADEDSQSAKSERVATRNNVCSRCWVVEATVMLYNSPVCDVCYDLAQANRMKGTKKRFQPPNPHLEAGKRLTKVCDSCRQKRKRCEHRRVVDATDPEAHRRKRGRKRKSEESSEDKSGNETFKSSASKYDEQEVIVVDDLEEDLGCSDASMSYAINESVDNVYRRETLRLEAIARKKILEADDAMERLRAHVNEWLDHAAKSKSPGEPPSQEQPAQEQPAQEESVLIN